MSFPALLREAKAAGQTAPRGRYAPSPTGDLHLGNARTALLAWLQIRLRQGTFIMRMEDLDGPRVVPGSSTRVLDDLEWLGLDWDEGVRSGGVFSPYEQSRREQLYAAALDMLEEQGRVFPCTCSRRDITMAASAPHGRMAVYPGTCRRASRPGPGGDTYAWRYRVPAEQLAFVDKVCGAFAQHLEREVGDFVLKRKDGLYAYQLAVVVDDLLMGVTDVVRGMDLIDSTPRQILLFRALGAGVPDYWHVPLMRDAHGRRMSKRSGSRTIAGFRAEGGSSSQLVGLLARSAGLIDSEMRITPSELLRLHDLESFRQRLARTARQDGPSQPSVLELKKAMSER